MGKAEFEKKLEAVPVVAHGNLDREDKELFDDMIKVKQYSGNLSLKVPKELHERLVIDAKNQGVSLNQYCLYKLAQSTSHIQESN